MSEDDTEAHLFHAQDAAPPHEAPAVPETLAATLAIAAAAPSMQFRRRAWLSFQRALDPLARPKPLRLPRH